MNSVTQQQIETQDHEILDELITCAREMVRAHARELTDRTHRHKEGRRPPEKWEISPAVIRGLLALVPRLLDARRVALGMPRLMQKAKPANPKQQRLPKVLSQAVSANR
ncbi:MAG: hypothetical protein ACYTDT_10195 [Planctomycetota bacterium]